MTDKKKEVGYDVLKLENQLCFPLYVCAKEIVKKYKPFLDKLELTYTQYIALMVLWEQKEINVKTLGEYLFLDSGTLTPVLKKLESRGYITRTRGKEDERILIIRITDSGMELQKKAVEIPKQVAGCVKLEEEEAKTLYILLHKLMEKI